MSHWTSAGQPRLKNQVFFQETEEGVLFDAGRESFALQGPKLYPLVARIVQLMDSGCSPAAMLEALPEKARPLLQTLMAALDEHGMLLDAQVERSLLEEAGDDVQLRELLRFLQDRAGDYRSAFLSWRHTRLALVGRGHTLRTALDALLASRVGALDVSLCDVPPADTQALERRLAEQGARDGAFAFRLGSVSALPDAACADAALVLLLADELGREDALALAREYARRAVPAIVAAVIDGRGVIARVSSPDSADCRDLLECLEPLEPGDAEAAHSPASRALLGAAAAFSAMKQVLGLEEVLRNSLTVVSPFLDLSQHPLLPAPTVGRSGELAPFTFPTTTELPDGRSLSPYERLRVELQPLFDPVTGYFSAEDARALPQLPLYHDAVRVRFPNSLNRASELVVGWGLDAEEAGLRTLRRALTLLIGATRGGGHVVVEFDEAACRTGAAVVATLTSDLFACEAEATDVRLEELADERVQILLRVLRLSCPGEVRARVHALRGQAAFWAECTLGAATLGAGGGASVLEALAEALGDACSARQLPGQARWRGPAPSFAAGPPDVSHDGTWLAGAGPAPAAAGAGPVAELAGAAGLALLRGVYVAQVETRPAPAYA